MKSNWPAAKVMRLWHLIGGDGVGLHVHRAALLACHAWLVRWLAADGGSHQLHLIRQLGREGPAPVDPRLHRRIAMSPCH